MAEVEIVTCPIMHTFNAGVLVHRIEEAFIPAKPSAFGGVSIGAAHVPTGGAVLHLALHLPDGETVMATFGLDGIRHLATLSNAAIIEIQSGKFDKPEVAQ